MSLKFYYRQIGGTEPNSSEILEIGRGENKTSIGHIRRNGEFWPTMNAKALTRREQERILEIATRFAEQGRSSVPRIRKTKT